VILLDVNVVLYAYRRDAPRHEHYAAWLHEALRGPDDVALADHVLTAVVRIATSPAFVATPVSSTEALTYVDAIRSAPTARQVIATQATWERFAALVDGDPAIRGNLVPDAWLAALALSHGASIATADRGFGRFPGLVHFDPAA